ncbi:MAG: radical SAM protein [Bacilli bacterium]|nr:radical SAM protein [Bacilli bacterium]
MKLKDKTVDTLPCVLPWKAMFMDDFDGHLRAVPCCSTWIKKNYGEIGNETTLDSLWNSSSAQEIRHLMATGHQKELCAPDCHWLNSGHYSESSIQIIDGPEKFIENQELNNEEIQQRKLILKSLPIAIRVIPTMVCNLHCRMCFQFHNMEVTIPDKFYDDIHKVFPFLYDYQLHGGEVLISKEFPHWVKPELFKLNPQLHLSLISNGSYIPLKTKEVLKQVRINYITVSLNAATRKTYKYISGHDLFDKVVDNIIYLRELGQQNPIKNFLVYLSFVIMRCNYKELPEFIGLANSLNLPFRLLLIEGNRGDESFYSDKIMLQDVLHVVNEVVGMTKSNSISEVLRVQISLEQSIINYHINIC